MSEKEIFKNQLSLHLEKVAVQSHDHAEFVHAFFDDVKLEDIAIAAEKKIAQTLSDGQEHTCMLAVLPVCYDICVLPIPLDKAAAYFERQYGGFGKLMARIIHEHPAFTLQGCKILTIIVYGRHDTKCWANLAIIAPHDSPYPNATVIPVDLLTEQERRQTNR